MNDQGEMFLGKCPRCGYPDPARTSWTPAQRTTTIKEAMALAAAGVELHHLARWDDPETSQIAAYKGGTLRVTHRVKLLYAMMKLREATVRAACAAAGLAYHAGERRFSELKQMGLVVPTGRLVLGPEHTEVEVYWCNVASCAEPDPMTR